MKNSELGFVHIKNLLVIGVLLVAIVGFVYSILTGNLDIRRQAATGEATPPPTNFLQALHLSGDSYVEVADAGSLNARRDFTAEAWIKPTQMYETTYVFQKGSTQTNYYLYSMASPIPNSSNYSVLFRFETRSATSGCQLVNVTKTITMTQSQLLSWHHVAGVIQPDGAMHIYVDGEKQTDNNNTFTPGCSVSDFNNTLIIGGQKTNNSSTGVLGGFKGYIDEVRVSMLARYQSNFTPSRTVFPVDDTSILYLGSFNNTLGATVGPSVSAHGPIQYVTNDINSATPAPGTPTPAPITCTRQTPTVTIDPGNQIGKPGQALSYTLKLKNNDSVGCPKTLFSHKINYPSGWNSGMGTSTPMPAAALNPGETFSYGFPVTSLTTASAGSYQITASVSSQHPQHSLSTFATYTVDTTPPPSFSVTGVNGFKAEVQAGEMLSLGVVVKESDGTYATNTESFTVGTVVFSSQNVVVTTNNTTFNTGTNTWDTNLVAPKTAGTYKLRAYAQCTNTLPATNGCLTKYGSSMPMWESTFTVLQPTFNNKPVLSTHILYSARPKKPFTLTITGYDKDVNDTLTMTFSKLPNGVTNKECTYVKSSRGDRVNVTCTLTGIINNRGLYTIPVVLRDSRGASVQRNINLLVL